jgi:hypothetical protein
MLMIRACVLSALAGAGVLLVWLGIWRLCKRQLPAPGGVIGMAVSVIVGCFLLDIHPHWPPKEDLDRFFFLILPAALLVECLPCRKWVLFVLVWALRLGVAASVPRVILHGSIYLADVGGAGTREWTDGQIWLLVPLFAATVVLVRILLAPLPSRPAGRFVPLALAVVDTGASLTIMLSGYLTGGQAGLPLAAALGGIGVMTLLWPNRDFGSAALGLGVPGLAALVLMGRFFGELSTVHALLLFLAPLLAWLPELPKLRRLQLVPRGVLLLVLIALPVGWSILGAQRRFAAAEQSHGGDEDESAAEDFYNQVK